MRTDVCTESKQWQYGDAHDCMIIEYILQKQFVGKDLEAVWRCFSQYAITLKSHAFLELRVE